MNSKREIREAGGRPSTARRLTAPLRLVARTALRMFVSSLIFFVCAALTLRLLGYDLELPPQLEEYFEGVERLTDVLS